MRELEKKAWLENIVSVPGPASKRLAERLIRRTVKHEVLDNLDTNINPEQLQNAPDNVINYHVQYEKYMPSNDNTVPGNTYQEHMINNSLNIVQESDALLNKVASFNEKYNV